nr:octopamine receptor 1 isoform X1 [Haliclona caerulea]
MNNSTSWLNNTTKVENIGSNAGGTMMVNYTHIVLYSILLLSSLLGNVLVIAVVFANRNLRTNFNHLIVNMAVSDLFIPLLILPWKIVEGVNGSEWLVHGPLGQALCKLCIFFSDISPAVSVFSLVVVAVNRYMSIAHPMSSQVFSRKKSCVLISITWITSAVIFSPYFYTFSVTNDKQCKWTWWYPGGSDLAKNIFYWIVTATIFIIPLAAIIIMYSLMAYKIILNSKDIEKMLNDKQARRRRGRNKNIFYVSIVIVCCFIFLWGPYHCLAVVFLTGNFSQSSEVTNTVIFVVQYLGYLNSAVNPCVYFIFLKHFRQGLRNLISGKKKSKDNSFTLLSSRRDTAHRLSKENGKIES